MALVVFDRVQETTATTGTGTITLGGAVGGYQSFAVIGDGNTTFYCIVNGSDWEVGIGTYTASGTTLARTTVLSNSLGNTSPISLTGSSSVFVTYPAGKSVNLDASGNVGPLGTITSGVWNGTTIPVAYGGTGATASTGANSVVLRDANQNIYANSVTQELDVTTSAGGTTVLTAGSSHFQILIGTNTQTFQLPDATTLPTGSSWIFDNDSTGNLYVVNNTSGAIDTVAPGGYATVFLELNGTSAGTWGRFGMIPSEVNWGTNSLDMGGSTVITNGIWQGTPVASGYGGTGLTTFTGANNALYSTGASTLTAGTLPVLAGGTGATTASGARTNFGATTVGSNMFTLTNPSAVTFPRFNADNTVSALDAASFRTAIGAGTSSATGTVTSVSGTGTASGLSLSGTVTTSGSLTLSGTVNSLAAGTYGISISGNAATATTAASATTAANYLPLSGGTMSGVLYNTNSSIIQGQFGGVNRGYLYNDTSGFGLLSSGGSWALQIPYGGAYAIAPESMRSPIFYDQNNTAYYGDFASTSRFNSINCDESRVQTYFFTDQQYGSSLVGAYSSTRFQGVYSMGYSYRLPLDGSGPGNLYGLTWSYPSAGGVAGNLNTHGLLALENGGFLAAFSGSVRARDDMRAPIYYDSNNSGYYMDPNGRSNIAGIQADDWFRPIGGCGVYWESYGRGIRASDLEFSYGNIGTYGAGLNGWRGYGINPNNSILMSNGSTTGLYNPQWGWMMQMDSVGNVTFGNNITAYSDIRLKDNIREIDNPIERRNTLAKSAIKYERDGKTRIGYGAQYLREGGCGEFVSEAEDDAYKLATGLGTLSVDYGETAAVLAVASKMTDDKVELLEARIAQLEKIIEGLTK